MNAYTLHPSSAKLRYIEPQGTGINGSIYPRFIMSHLHLFALTVVGSFTVVHSFIHSFGHFYSAPSSPVLLRGAPDYSTDTVSEFHAEAHRQL